MATITESVTTTEEIEYETPVYGQFGTLFIKVYDVDKMMVVDSSKLSIKLVSYPSLGITKIDDMDEILEAAFTAAYDAVILAFEGT